MQRGYFTSAAKFILLVTTCHLFYSGVSNSLILFYMKKADIRFKVREKKGSCTLYKKCRFTG